MSDTAAHLVGHVFPHVAVRQWVLTLPIPLRYRIAFDHKLESAILALFLATVFAWLRGLEEILRDGVADRASLRSETLAALLEPFQTPESRRALAAAGIGVERRGFIAIAQKLPALRLPVRIIYGERDRLLPDVATTMARVKTDLPQAEVTAFPDRGHFIQLEAPRQVDGLLAQFFAG